MKIINIPFIAIIVGLFWLVNSTEVEAALPIKLPVSFSSPSPTDNPSPSPSIEPSPTGNPSPSPEAIDSASPQPTDSPASPGASLLTPKPSSTPAPSTTPEPTSSPTASPQPTTVAVSSGNDNPPNPPIEVDSTVNNPTQPIDFIVSPPVALAVKTTIKGINPIIRPLANSIYNNEPLTASSTRNYIQTSALLMLLGLTLLYKETIKSVRKISNELIVFANTLGEDITNPNRLNIPTS